MCDLDTHYCSAKLVSTYVAQRRAAASIISRVCMHMCTRAGAYTTNVHVIKKLVEINNRLKSPSSERIRAQGRARSDYEETRDAHSPGDAGCWSFAACRANKHAKIAGHSYVTQTVHNQNGEHTCRRTLPIRSIKAK